MIPPSFIVYGAVAVAMIAGLVARQRARAPMRHLARRAAQLPETPMEEARDGEWVKLLGRVSLVEPLLSPLSGRRCACYRLEAAIDTDFGGRIEEHAERDFELRDVGSARVRAGSGVILVGPVEELAGERVRDFFSRRGRDLLSDTPMSGSESSVEDGCRVAVVGVAHWVPDVAASATYRETGRRLELRGDERRPIVILWS